MISSIQGIGRLHSRDATVLYVLLDSSLAMTRIMQFILIVNYDMTRLSIN